MAYRSVSHASHEASPTALFPDQLIRSHDAFSFCGEIDLKYWADPIICDSVLIGKCQDGSGVNLKIGLCCSSVL